MSKARILIVEDEAITAKAASRILAAASHNVVGAAKSYRAAEAFALEHLPDLACIDIVLDGKKDDVSFAATLREECNCAILFLTAQADDQTIDRAIAVTPNGYVVKPFGRSDLVAGVAAALAKFHAADAPDPAALSRLSAPVSGGLAAYHVNRLKQFISRNFHREIGLDELASLYELSTAHFATQFRASVGIAPHQYIVRERIAEAKRLLRATDWSIAEIGGAVGFASSAHFSSSFRNHVGVTPTHYRRI